MPPKRSKYISDLELARKYNVDQVDVELKEVDISVGIRKVYVAMRGLFSLELDGINISAKARGLALTIAAIGLVSLAIQLIH